MILRGKCRNDFNTWCMDKGFERFNPKDYSMDISQAMSCSVVILFFDSVGITVDVMPIFDNPIKWMPNTFWLEKELTMSDIEDLEYSETRQEAQIKAIEYANQIYNENI